MFQKIIRFLGSLLEKREEPIMKEKGLIVFFIILFFTPFFGASIIQKVGVEYFWHVAIPYAVFGLGVVIYFNKP